MEATNFYFSKPMVLPNGWNANFTVQYENYIISFSGDDSQSGSSASKRHYLYIEKDGVDVTKELGFEDYGNPFKDFLSAIEKVKALLK